MATDPFVVLRGRLITDFGRSYDVQPTGPAGRPVQGSQIRLPRYAVWWDDPQRGKLQVLTSGDNLEDLQADFGPGLPVVRLDPERGQRASVRSTVCGIEAAAFLNEHPLSGMESWEYIVDLSRERGCDPEAVRAFVVDHLYDTQAARALAAAGSSKGTRNMFGLFNRRGRRDVTRIVGRGKGRHVYVKPPTTVERRALARAGWDDAFGLPVSEQSQDWISRHPPVDDPTPAFPLTKMQWARAARARAMQGLNGGTLTKAQAQSIIDRATRFVRMMVNGQIPSGASRSMIGMGRGKIDPPGPSRWNELYDAKIVGSRGSYRLEEVSYPEERRAAANRRTRRRRRGRGRSVGSTREEMLLQHILSEG